MSARTAGAARDTTAELAFLTRALKAPTLSAATVAGDVCGGDAELVEQLGDGDGLVLRGVPGPLGLPRRLTVPGQVDGDDVAVRGQRRNDRIPAAAGEALAMQQDQRVTAASPVKGQPRATRRLLHPDVGPAVGVVAVDRCGGQGRSSIRGWVAMG
jgi:hypothetical protein